MPVVYKSSERASGERQRGVRPIATLNIRVQAGARKERILGWSGELLRVAVQAPPVEGAANRAVIRLLARCFDISPSRVQLLRGEKSKSKTVELTAVTDEALRRVLDRLLDQSHTTEARNDDRAAQANR